MWALLFSSGITTFDVKVGHLTFVTGTLVTSSPDSVNEMLGPSIHVEDITNQAENGELQIIRLVDPTDRNHFIPLAQCRTWFVSRASRQVVNTSIR